MAGQKLMLLQSVAGNSVPARRVMRSNHEAAKARLEDARHLISQSELALREKCAKSASEMAIDGIKLAREAFGFEFLK